jgi:hypothetical protein
MRNDASDSMVYRLGFAVGSLFCLLTSIFVLYKLLVIDFASGTWAFVNVPKSEPRAGLAELALVILQLAGGIALAISSASIKDIRRSLKWSPLFILVFAVLTWIASWAAGPLHLFRSG